MSINIAVDDDNNLFWLMISTMMLIMIVVVVVNIVVNKKYSRRRKNCTVQCTLYVLLWIKFLFENWMTMLLRSSSLTLSSSLLLSSSAFLLLLSLLVQLPLLLYSNNIKHNTIYRDHHNDNLQSALHFIKGLPVSSSSVLSSSVSSSSSYVSRMIY